ncbi:uroporphyrinogen decarboxylase family protein [Desulfoluna spongiiphila]|uniref:Uroporphyrinogen decarboxylase n=1 Tax=Desulfoluna spongiiphila TaxID=419481 RepID=A0A1G5HP97_9BACT|nr:uroporphyrinogen decarboxylase family protein [Desulfoluna spongiiphila]SCY65573.1 uroporphyrinogen decarboxylase [Desulfoluna spongiiphila]VVS95694.1 uroporphyrinogen decarboxylase (uro-d) [Desulfoluna spongiiphila]
MNHKERALTALNHEEPDRVPIDLGGRNTTLMLSGYEAFKKKLGKEEIPTQVMSKVWQTAYVDEYFLQKFGADFRQVRPRNVAVLGSNKPREFAEDGCEIFTDQWGVKRKVDGEYATIYEYNLKNPTLDALEAYPWPDTTKDFDFSGVREEAKKLHDEGEYAVVGCMGNAGNLFDQSWYLRGMPEFFMDMMSRKDFAHALMRKVCDVRKENARLFLEEAGEFIDVFQCADDLAMQNAPFMSLPMYREFIKPYQAELFGYIKGMTKAKLYYHSCGAVTTLLDDLIEVGVDILNPIQVSATGMETDNLKKRYGKQLSFWGGIDTFEVLPNGSVRDVRNEVAKRIGDLAPGGGYILGSVHNMQSDVPPENVIAMLESAVELGQYPIAS